MNNQLDLVDKLMLVGIGAGLIYIDLISYTRYPVFIFWAGTILIIFGVTRK